MHGFSLVVFLSYLFLNCLNQLWVKSDFWTQLLLTFDAGNEVILCLEMSSRNCTLASAASHSKSQRMTGTTSRWHFLTQTEKAGSLKWVRTQRKSELIAGIQRRYRVSLCLSFLNACFLWQRWQSKNLEEEVVHFDWQLPVLLWIHHSKHLSVCYL